MNYQPIENYGIIGDLDTVALVGKNGSIDFMCFPYFDSPSIFAALLDKNKGGNFDIHPIDGEVKYKQFYLSDTNVLVTKFFSKDGVGEVTDFMPVKELYEGKELIRRVTAVRGKVHFRMSCSPRFNYASSTYETKRNNSNEIVFISNNEDGLALQLSSNIPLEIKDNNTVCEFTLTHGEVVYFRLEKANEYHNGASLEDHVEKKLSETLNYWENWISKSRYRGRWMETVNRSALVLKLLTSRTYGSIIAAPTFSLPESIGGQRNWDYRYTWIRDASFTVDALINLGFKKEAESFMNWLEKECNDVANTGHLGLMYRIDGKTELSERELDHLEGYKKSSPVRIGNHAYKQFQLDIYGELMDAVYSYDKHVRRISHDFWISLSNHIDWVCDHWEDEDNGIWEVRTEKKDFLYSKVMCWVAIDRGIKIGKKRSLPLPERWQKERDRIYGYVFNNFWNKEKKSFVQFKGADIVDASLLLMPLVKFISPKDPRWLSTLEFIEKELITDCLVYRYQHEKFFDGFKHPEGTFSICSFWYFECLSRAGKHQKARHLFEKMLGYANHLGLYSEQLGMQGEHLGNFPQGFTHIGLINAAYDLDRRLNEKVSHHNFEE